MIITLLILIFIALVAPELAQLIFAFMLQSFVFILAVGLIIGAATIVFQLLT